MGVLTGRVVVPAPNPVIPRYGLFRVATGPLDLPIHARGGGLQYDTNTCDLPLGYDVTCQDSISPSRTKTLDSPIRTITGDPFIVYSDIKCSPVGLANLGQEAINSYLYQQLVSGEQSVVERIFATQANGESPGLMNNVNVVNLGAATAGIVQATGILEDWLYSRYGLPGVLHVPMIAAPYWSGSHVIDLDGNFASGVWRTQDGTAVSFGNYGGLGPTGQVPAAGTTWVYITGEVACYRTPDSELFVPPMGQIINRSTNVISIVMEREYVVTFDCYVAAILVSLTDTAH
jgi:hypothetical protein